MVDTKLEWKDLEEIERDLVREASAGLVIHPKSERERQACERLRWFGLMEFTRDAYELTHAGYEMFLR